MNICKRAILSLTIFCSGISVLFSATEAKFSKEVLYVMPTGAKQASDQKNTFSSLSQAYKAAKAKGGNAEIVLLDGVHSIYEDCVNMQHYPSDNSSLTIRGQSNKAEIIGGIRISANNLKKVKDANLLSKLPSKREGNLYYLDLKEFGVKKVGKMCYIPSNNRFFTEAFYSDGELTLARYPNADAMIAMGKTINKGISLTKLRSSKTKEKKIAGILAYDDPRHERWVNAPDLWISGSFNYGWFHETAQLEKIDTKNKTITFKTFLAFALSPYSKKLDINSYFVFNLFEEIDADREYYIDRENLIFYVMLKDTPKREAYFDFSLNPTPIIKLKNVENLTIKNLKFSAAQNSVIKAKDADFITIDSCEFFNIGYNVIEIEAKSVDKHSPERLQKTNNLVQNCKIFDTGTRGIALIGGNLEKLLPSRNKIYNCEFYNNCKWRKCYSTQASVSGVGGTISNCYFHDQTHQSVGFTGAEHTVEYNFFERCGKKYDDMGVVYTGREPHCAGNAIRYNIFTECTEKYIKSKMCGIYIDDGSSNVLIEKNLFCRTGTKVRSFAAIYMNGGKGMMLKENVFIDCQASAAHGTWQDSNWKKYWSESNPDKIKYANTDIFLKKYPQLKNIQDPTLPRYNSMIECCFYKTPMLNRGFWFISRNQVELEPAEKLGEVKYWTRELVKKYFSKNKVVADILSKNIGLVPPMKKN